MPTTATDVTFFPMMVKLEGRECVVIGAGAVAEEKIAGLLPHLARVTVVSPQATKKIQTQAQAGTLTWKQRRFAAKDIAGAFLAIAATDSPAVNAAVFRACTARGVLCNSVDDPPNCDFFYPAIVRRGALQIAISTNGRSPALASRLRRELEQQFGPEWTGWVEYIANERNQILSEQISYAERRERLLEIASPKAFREFLRKTRSRNTRSRSKRTG
jgi:precorrin-2 dehydrogenase / sirohydrochlorin ferrochelatase